MNTICDRQTAYPPPAQLRTASSFRRLPLKGGVISVLFPSLVVAAALLAAPLYAAEADEDFQRLLAEHWAQAEDERTMFRRDPDAWYFRGRLPAVTADARQRRADYNEEVIDRLATIPLASLSAANQVSYRVFQFERLAERQHYRQLDHLYPLTNRSGWHLSAATAPAGMTFATTADYEDYLESLADYPRYNREHIALLREAMDRGHTQFCESMTGFERSISAEVVSTVTDSSFYAPFADMPERLSEAQRRDFQRQGARIIEDEIIPAYRELLRFYTEEYAPACRRTEGITALPQGEAYYAYLLAFFTTTDMSAEAIHELGLQEVARIRREMEEVMTETDYYAAADGDVDFADFLAYLRDDPRFYSDEPEDLMEKASRIAKRIDGQLPRLFATLPRTPYDIQEIPASIAEKTTIGYYSPPPGDGRTPGSYYVNTSLLHTRPLYTLEALTLHEAVPGHHLQMALALELDGLPEFRRHLYHSAFGEGWALYAESLGSEVGFYADPYADFGRLTYEMWRAVRLVVDTGIHAFGWSRQEAIDYMAANTALTLHDITTEIDRYITWPGQATAYKIGELRIHALRREAEEALGDDFDLRAFHDAVLSNGSVPIAVLEDLIREWIASEAAR